MSIPWAGTLITVLRPTSASVDVEPYSETGDTQFEVVARNVRASIGTFSRTVSATEVRRGGEQSTLVLQLTCDIPSSKLTHSDKIIDQTTDEEYEIHWVFLRVGLGLDHYTAEIGQSKGLVS